MADRLSRYSENSSNPKQFSYKRKQKIDKLQIIKDIFDDIVDDFDNDIKISFVSDDFYRWHRILIRVPQQLSKDNLKLLYRDIVSPKLNYLEDTYNIKSFKPSSWYVVLFNEKHIGNMEYVYYKDDTMNIYIFFKY